MYDYENAYDLAHQEIRRLKRIIAENRRELKKLYKKCKRLKKQINKKG